MPRRRGFALVELMIVLAALLIVAVVALPSFQGRAVRTNRQAAEVVLRQIVQQQDLWYSERRTYAPKLSLLGYPADSLYIEADGVPKSGATSESTYRIRLAAVGGGELTHCTTNPATTASTRFAYVVIAEPQGFQAVGDVACGSVCLYSDGHHGASPPDADDTAIKNCWAR
jgi:type IV pilus assembly protein PilE